MKYFGYYLLVLGLLLGLGYFVVFHNASEGLFVIAILILYFLHPSHTEE